tara:strand:+ start:335 stop:541 length:207 start_codon:yes stop_codon:yes gene_type:complete
MLQVKISSSKSNTLFIYLTKYSNKEIIIKIIDTIQIVYKINYLVGEALTLTIPNPTNFKKLAGIHGIE